jgi:hypothetical protein
MFSHHFDFFDGVGCRSGVVTRRRFPRRLTRFRMVEIDPPRFRILGQFPVHRKSVDELDLLRVRLLAVGAHRRCRRRRDGLKFLLSKLFPGVTVSGQLHRLLQAD